MLLEKQQKSEMTVNQTQDDYKILKIKYDELKSKYHDLWDVENIVNWMIDFDEDRHAKYRDDLIANMINEEIDGSCLSILQVNDLHRLGIINFKDKKQIYQSIQELVGDGQ